MKAVGFTRPFHGEYWSDVIDALHDEVVMCVLLFGRAIKIDRKATHALWHDN